MTPRDVIYRLTYTETKELAAICLERVNEGDAAALLIAQYDHEELAEIGLLIRAHLQPGGA